MSHPVCIRLKSITETKFHHLSRHQEKCFSEKSVILSYRFNNLQYINEIQKLTKAYI